MGSKLKVEFGDPQCGWMRLTIRAGASGATLTMSHTPYESLDEMVGALRALRTGDERRSVRAMEEPEVCELRFEQKNCALSLAISRRTSPRRCETLLEAVGSFQEVCLPFWRALRILQTRLSEQEFELRWRRPFPVSGMKKLSADVGRLRDR